MQGDLLTTRWRASNALLVAIDLTGVILPQYGDHPKTSVGLAELRAIARLCDREPWKPEPAVEPFLRMLLDRGLLVTDERPPTNEVEASAPVERREMAGVPPPMLVLPNPVLFRCAQGRFESANHEGEVTLGLGPEELLALSQFRVASAVTTAHEAHVAELRADALDRAAFDDLISRAIAGGLLVAYDPSTGDNDRQAHQAELMRQGMRAKAAVNAAFSELEAAHDREAGGARVPVVGVHTNWSSAPAGLGAVIASAKGFEGGALCSSYDFRPRLVWDEPQLRAVATGQPGIYLFSNYVWSSDENLRLSRLVKEANPHNVTIHGGPNTPKYRPDVERYFAEHTHVDIAVHGEGEATFVELLRALEGQLADGPADLAPLEAVAGLSFRLGGQVVSTGSRERIADLNTIPSPILTGLFDGFIPAGPLGGVALETNRGCPYGCTFCDWGSATLSRIRKFDLDRVFAELEWCARNKILTVGIADANFGIFERDVEIAEKIAELKSIYGYPKNIGNNYAKNTVKHLAKIIEIFTEAGIVAEGKMSMQSFDDETLAIIRRKNIKVEKYDELAVEFRRNRLPLSVDLMLGLPGSTPETFKNDLQECVDRDVRVLVQPTMLLPNSPMNEPEYRAEQGIVALPGEYVMETASFTRDEWHQMHRLGSGVWLFENFGILRQVATYVRAETGRREVDFYESLIEAADAAPDAWPFTAIVLRVLPHAMVPPVSWRFFLDEVKRWLVEEEGLADDSALATVLTVQHNLLPARDRTFPVEIRLAHDYVAWRQAMLDERDRGHDDWHVRLAPLRGFGPGTLTVDDPYQICTTALEGSLTSIVHESSWDFESPVSRPRQRSAQADEAGDRPLERAASAS